MRHRILLSAIALAIALVAAGTAGAGGWATVGFTPLPDGTAVGGTWSPKITILQHGVTPLSNLRPVITIVEAAGDSHEFYASESSEAGVYDTDVTFPTAGSWRLTIDSTFGDSRVTYGPFQIGAAPGGIADEPFRFRPVVGVVGALILAAAAALAFGVLRQRRLRPAA